MKNYWLKNRGRKPLNFCGHCRKADYRSWFHAQGFICEECHKKGITRGKIQSIVDVMKNPPHIYGFKTPTKHMIMASTIPLIEILTLDPKTLPRKGIFRETVLQNQRQELSKT